jgi:GntR family transcriptional regulator
VIARNPSLTDQVKAHLKERIVQGDFDEGRIPAENDLASDLGVSRTTIRDALGRLEQEGAIYRRQGAGTFVNEPGLQIKSRLEDIWSYEEVLRDHGYTPSVRLLGSETIGADPDIAQSLGISGGDEVLVMEKLFLEDDVPVVLTFNRIPLQHLNAEAGEPTDAPIYAFLEANSDRTLTYYLSEIIPVALPAAEAGRLEMAPGTPALSFEEVGFDQDNEPIVHATSFFRDDLLRFRLIRRNARG